MTQLRAWQAKALQQYLRAGKPDFLAAACPASGKTTWSLAVARKLKEQGVIQQVVVVTPSAALRTQWSDHTACGIHLRAYVPTEPFNKAGFDGVVTTYQGLRHTAATMRARVGPDTLVILDEIHHAAVGRRYGDVLEHAFQHAGRRLMLTGTPWRTDRRQRMPFVEFDSTDALKVDSAYSYGDAVRDGVCRRIQFPLVNGMSRWRREGDPEVKSARFALDVDLNRADRSDATMALLAADGDWMRDILQRAHAHLSSLRRETPNAAGLVIAYDKDHAAALQAALQSAVGVKASVVVSGDDNEGGNNVWAREEIRRFTKSHDPWIIAVKMIAEGVDIPRLVVGVYGSTVTTAMFFNQVVGRFVRVPSGESAPLTAQLYVPPIDALYEHVRRIEESLPQQLADGTPPPPTPRIPGDGPGHNSGLVVIDSSSDGLDRVHTLDGDIAGDVVESWSERLRPSTVPPHYATELAGLFGMAPPPPTTHSDTVTVEEDAIPLHRQEKELRDRITKKWVGKVAKHCYGDPRSGQMVYRDLARRVGAWVPEMSIAQLQRAEYLLIRALETGERL